MPLRYGHTLSDSRLDFENLTQSEAREPPTSGCKSVMEGHTKVLIVSIALSYTYTMVKHQYLRKRVITGDINSTYGELILRNKFPISGMILSEVSYKVFHK